MQTGALADNSKSQKTFFLKLRQVPSSLRKSGTTVISSFGEAQLDRIGAQIGVTKIELISGNNAAEERAGITRQDELFHWVKVTALPTMELDDVLERYQKHPDVECVQANHVYRIDYVPNDPDVSEQWALLKLGAFDAWDIERGSPDVVIGVIDTGVDYEHPDLRENVWVNAKEDLNGNHSLDGDDLNGIDDDGNGFVDDVIGWDFTDAPNFPDGGDYLDRDNDPADEHGHGTSVSGIIASEMDNDLGIAGIAPGCRVMCLRAGTVKGNLEEDDVASAILYAIANGAQIINMSWGDTVVSRLMDDVIRYAYERGCIMVASAGNNATDVVHYPSGNQETISVGAVDEEGFLASFSNYGPTVDVMAPGVNIYSTAVDAKYATVQGTSFSAPYVSGISALLLSQDQALSVEDVRGKLIASAVDLGTAGWDRYYAAGMVNAASALGLSDFSVAHITTPQLDQAFNTGPIVIQGSAWSPAMSEYILEFGRGLNPDRWQEILRVTARRVFDDTLAIWQNIPTVDDSYILRLSVVNRDGSVVEDNVRFFIDNSPPVITDFSQQPMIVDSRYGVLIQFHSDDLGQGRVHYRRADSDDLWSEVLLKYRTKDHRLLMTPDFGQEIYELKVAVENGAGMSGQSEQTLVIDLRHPPIESSSYIALDQMLGPGHLLNKSYDFNHNALPELILGEYENEALSNIGLFEFSNGGFAKVHSTDFSVIPRDIGDADGDGKWEILGGYGINSYLFESKMPGGYPTALIRTWEGDANTQYWASRIADGDGDGRGEILMKVVHSEEGNSGTQFEVWESYADNSYAVVAALTNPTSGDNGTGVPHSEVGDFDNDGKNEILLGDSDGDIYIYEATGDNTYVMTWQDHLPLQDTIDYINCGDYDGDGVLEFLAGSHTDPNLNTEHEYDARHWYYRVYDSEGDNTYMQVAEWFFFGFESPKSFDSGVSSGDVDGDDRDEIFICVFPDFYIIDYDNVTAEYTPTWYIWPVRSNATIVADADNDGINEFYINDGTAVKAYRSIGALTGPSSPVEVDAIPLDEKHVLIRWESVAGADDYIIYRGHLISVLENIGETAVNTFIDSTVQPDIDYYYAVQVVDYEATPTESRLSQRVRAKPGARPFVRDAAAITDQAVRLRFSEPMSESIKNPANYVIDNGLGSPTSVIYDKSGSEVILSMKAAFPSQGTYSVTVANVADIDRTPLDTTRNRVSFSYSISPSPPYLIEGRLLNATLLELEFNEPMDVVTCSDPTNYDLGKQTLISKVELMEPDFTKVHLTINATVPIGPLGKRYTVSVKAVKSAKNVAIQSGRGDRLTLIFSKADVSQAFVYPNPFRPGLGRETITFANLTHTATVRVLDIGGMTIKTLEEKDGDGGVEWDLRDEYGNAVSSGIYLFIASGNGDEKIGKFAILR